MPIETTVKLRNRFNLSVTMLLVGADDAFVGWVRLKERSRIWMADFNPFNCSPTFPDSELSKMKLTLRSTFAIRTSAQTAPELDVAVKLALNADSF